MISEKSVNLFNQKINFTAPKGCHEWMACRNPAGYGQVTITSYAESAQLSHRIAWIIVHGLIPNGLHVLHHCDNPPCCNVEHLFLGTPRTNVDDKMAKGRHPCNATGYMPTGKAHHFYNTGLKLTREEAFVVRAEAGLQKDIARRHGIAPSMVSRIKSGEYWRD